MSAAGEPTEGWAPEVENRGRRRPWARLLLGVLAVALVVLLALPFLASSRIPRTEVDGLSAGGTPTNVLVAGSDSREGLTREEMRELSTGVADEIGGARTDTILLLSFRGSEMALLSFPRDLWVERCDGSVGRINVAESIDGPSCLVTTVQNLSGLPVHHYAEVTFGGFRDIVDAVGGVELCLDEPISDRDAGIDLPDGCQRLDGADALGYVRVRKIDDDLARIERQQRFLQALAREAVDPATLLNPVRLWSLSNDAGGALTVDDSLGTFGLGRLAWAGRSLARGDVATHTVPVTPGTTSGGAEVLYPRQPEADQLFGRFRDGSILAAAAPRPEQVSVTVLNAAGVSGLAGQVGELLEGRGYDVVDIGNTDRREHTVVRYPVGQRAEAELVADDLPGDPRLEESSQATTVVIELGPDTAGEL